MLGLSGARRRVGTVQGVRERMRYDFAPLDELLVNRDISRALKISSGYLAQYRSEGLSTLQADRFAIRLGLHPSEIWPSWADDADLEDRCPWCGEWSFDRKFCSVIEQREHQKESRRDMTRARNWWKRLDRYRHSTCSNASGFHPAQSECLTAPAHDSGSIHLAQEVS